MTREWIFNPRRGHYTSHPISLCFCAFLVVLKTGPICFCPTVVCLRSRDTSTQNEEDSQLSTHLFKLFWRAPKKQEESTQKKKVSLRSFSGCFVLVSSSAAAFWQGPLRRPWILSLLSRISTLWPRAFARMIVPSWKASVCRSLIEWQNVDCLWG